MQILGIVGQPKVTVVMYSDESDRAEIEKRVQGRKQAFNKEKRQFNSDLARHAIELDFVKSRLFHDAEGANFFPLDDWKSNASMTNEERRKAFRV